MLHPKRIKDIKINFAFNLAHSLITKLEFLIAVEFLYSSEGELVAILLFTHETNRVNQIFVEIKDALKVLGKFLVNTRAELNKLSNFVFVETRNLWANIIAIENLATHRINDLTVTVNDVIVLDNVLAAIEVEAFDAFLCGFERLANHTVANWHIVINTETLHNHRNAIALEDAHKIVFTRYEELSRTWVSLTTTTTTKLIIDTTRIMTCSTNHDETAEFDDALAEFNIGTTTSHVGSESNCTLFASFSNNRSLALVVLCVQNLKWDIFFLEVSGNALVVCNRIRTDKHWLTAIMIFVNLSCNRLELSSFGTKD